MMDTTILRERLKALPSQPGVYIFRDSQGKVIYVGKAASLHNRVPSYFASPASLPVKQQHLVSKVADFEFIVTHSEQEALILENTLIKRHSPPYNVRLRDDKTYPYIKIDLGEEFPLVYFTRRVESDGARYFGPYASAWSVRQTLDLLKKLFPYRSCTKAITGQDPKPCLEYYIHRCVAPCIGAVDKEEYRQVIQQVILFLEGRTEEVLRDLRRRMEEASRTLEFERAAALRNQVNAIEKVSERQKVVSPARGDVDIIATEGGKEEAWVEVFFIRHGKLIERDHFIMAGAQDEEPTQVLAGFLKQFYSSATMVPAEVLLPVLPAEADLVGAWLKERRGGPVRLLVPQRGEKRRLVEMVEENARQGLQQMRVRWMADTDAVTSAMAELQEQLNLPGLPQRMECYDISNIQGTNPVGSMVVFENGKPRSSHYRRFRIKAVEGINDYAMVQEVLRRRFKRAQGERVPSSEGREEGPREAAWALPDLLLIDGGKGHLSAAQEVLLGLGLTHIPLASIAKEREEIFIPQSQEPVVLPRNSHALHLVQRIRDEAHRFAITYHQRLRSKRGIASAMDRVPGIGPKRKRLLLRRFGSVQAIKGASLEELAAVPGMTRRLAEKVKEWL